MTTSASATSASIASPPAISAKFAVPSPSPLPPGGVLPAGAGFTGSVIVAEFPSLADAEAWAAADPYMTSGVFTRCTVKPFRKTLP